MIIQKKLNKTKLIYLCLFIIVLVFAIFFYWRYVSSQQQITSLEIQVNAEMGPQSILEQNNQIDPPSGEVDTTNWSTFKDEQKHFSIKFPDNWEVYTSKGVFVILKRISIDQREDVGILLPLSVMESTNMNGPQWKREITLVSGQQADYYFSDGFDHYLITNGDTSITFFVPARSYNGLYTEQELNQAIQIINTYQTLP